MKNLVPMQTKIIILALICCLAMAVSADAGMIISQTAVGTATNFPSSSLSGLNGTLSFSDVLASPAGGTIAGGQSQGGFLAGGTFWGEVFKWAGSSNGDVLSAFSWIVNYSATHTYQPVLMDLGTGTYNTSGASFNPGAFSNLLSTPSVTYNVPSTVGQSFVEFDLSGSDAVTMTVGHSYAFGWLTADDTSGMFFMRDSGVQGDPNGVPFSAASGLSSGSATVPGWGGGPRNIMFGLYTTPVPEPSTLAMLGLALAGALVIRRRK